jgi:hypothetical protein
MKAKSLNNSAIISDWIVNTKYKITFDFSSVQKLKEIKGIVTFTEHFLIIKIIEEKKKSNVFEVLKNMFHPIFCDEENHIYLNYCLIKKFNTQHGLIDIIITNPVYKRNYNLNITSIEKNQLLFASSLKIEEIIKIGKSINAKIINEIKHLVEKFIFMITAFKEILDRLILKNGLLEDKIIHALSETKKFYEKNIKELKKQNQFKNYINKKILKSMQSHENSVSLLSRIEADNFASFEMILPDLRSIGLKLIDENINLFFEITSLENNALNLKNVDKSKVTDNLKNINFKNNNNNYDDNMNGNHYASNFNSSKYINSENHYENYNTKSSIRNNAADKLKAENSKSGFLNIKNYNLNEKYNNNNTHGNKSFDDSVLLSKNKIKILQSEFTKNDFDRKTELSVYKEPPKTPTHTIQNIKGLSIKKLNDTFASEKNHNNKINNSNNKDKLNTNNNENFNTYAHPNINFRIDSDTITDVNGLFEDIINKKNNNLNSNNCQINNNQKSYDSNNRPSTPNVELFLPKNKLAENPAFEIYYFENDLENNNRNNNPNKNNQEESENVSSSTKTNSKKEEINNSKTNEGNKYINNIKELKDLNNMQYPLDTPKFYAKNIPNNKSKARMKEMENINFAKLTKKINIIKDKHLFIVNNSWNSIFSNTSELFCRKYFEYCFDEYFPKFFVIEKDLNGIIKTDSFYSFLFYLRFLKNHLFTDENKIQFSNVFFYE